MAAADMVNKILVGHIDAVIVVVVVSLIKIIFVFKIIVFLRFYMDNWQYLQRSFPHCLTY